MNRAGFIRTGIALLVLCMSTVAAQAAGSNGVVTLDGVIEACQMVEVRSPVEAMLKEIRVDRGDRVDKDQVLAVLDSGPEQATVDLWRSRSDMDAAIKSAEARLEFSISKEKRMTELYGKQYISRHDKEEAEAERKLADAQVKEAIENKRIAELELQRAIENLNVRTIRSPFAGVVVDRYMNPGEVAVTDNRKPIMKLAKIDPLYVEVIAPVSLYGTIKEGAAVEVVPEVANGGKGRYMATVKQVDRVVDAASGTFAIRIELPNKQFLIPAGVKCRVKIRQN